MRCAGSDELEHVAPGRDSTHRNDRKLRRCISRIHRRERDRLQRGARVAAGGSGELRPQRSLVEREPADRVHERKPVGAGRFGGARDL